MLISPVSFAEEQQVCDCTDSYTLLLPADLSWKRLSSQLTLFILNENFLNLSANYRKLTLQTAGRIGSCTVQGLAPPGHSCLVQSVERDNNASYSVILVFL